MIRVAVTAPAFDAVAATLPLGSWATRRSSTRKGSVLASLPRRRRARTAPIKRFATPQGLASFFVFLCSDCASYSVGSTYFVDGDMLKSV